MCFSSSILCLLVDQHFCNWWQHDEINESKVHKRSKSTFVQILQQSFILSFYNGKEADPCLHYQSTANLQGQPPQAAYRLIRDGMIHKDDSETCLSQIFSVKKSPMFTAFQSQPTWIQGLLLQTVMCCWKIVGDWQTYWLHQDLPSSNPPLISFDKEDKEEHICHLLYLLRWLIRHWLNCWLACLLAWLFDWLLGWLIAGWLAGRHSSKLSWLFAVV